jgi:NAD(P)-dependent dehydrogenase (short-subunit alcohol dehydrogenase family)
MQKTVIILGGAGGIGSATAKLLQTSGWNVIIASRSKEKISAVAETLGVQGRICDATQFDQVENLFTEVQQKTGSLDAVVNCVGSVILKPAHLTSPIEWQETITKNLISAAATVRSATKLMLSSGGSIVLMSSAAAQIGIPNHEAIAAAKGGIISLTKSAAATYAPKKIRVNCICPGLVETPMTERITSVESSRKVSLGMHALGFLGSPIDIANAIQFFVEPEQRWITGQILGVDGGLGSLRVAGS